MKRLLPFILCFGLIWSGCRKGNPSWDTGLVLPIAHASLSIDNLVTDTLVNVNPDGSIRLVYSSDFLGINTDTIFEIPDTTISDFYYLPLPTNLSPGQYVINNSPNSTAYNLGSIQLVYAQLTTGTMIVKMQNDVQAIMLARYQIPSATKNGIPFDTTFAVPAAPNNTQSSFSTVQFDLSGYEINFTGANGSQVNTVTTLFTAQVDPNAAGQVPVTPSDTVGVINTFSHVRPYYIRGYFGNQTLQVGPEESDFAAFAKVHSGQLGLDSLTMSLRLENFVGMDSRLTINNIWSRNTRTGQSVYLTNSVVGSPININRASYSNTWPPVIPSTYNFLFNNGNSNVRALVENMPDKLGYDLTLITNPLGNVSGNNDFFYSDFGINTQLDVELPLNFYADQILIADTVETVFTGIENKEDILKGTLTLYAQNSFPFSAALQIYMLDINGQITDSIVAYPNAILSGITTTVSSYTVATGFTSSRIDMPLDEEQTQALLNSSRVVMKVIFDTNSAPAYVKIYNTNRLDLQLSADFDYHIGD